MPSNISTIRREIAAVLVALLGLAAHFVPALATVDPVWIDLAAGGLALAALALVENRIDGISLTALARVSADHLIRDDNVLEAIRAARALRGEPPEPDLSTLKPTGPPAAAPQGPQAEAQAMTGADKPAQAAPPPLDPRGVPMLGEVRGSTDRRLDGAATTRGPATREGAEHGRD